MKYLKNPVAQFELLKHINIAGGDQSLSGSFSWEFLKIVLKQS